MPVQTLERPLSAPPRSPERPSEPRPAFTGGVLGTVIFAIVLGAIFDGAFYALGRAKVLEPETAIRYGLVATMALYGLVFALVRSRVVASRARLFWSPGAAMPGVVLGALAGAVAGLLIIGAISGAIGHLSSDPVISVVVYEGGFARIAAALLIFVVAAPVVEELLFRGLLLESLRGHGRGAAVILSAVAFAIWHLRPQQLLYYGLAGVLLGLLYWRGGLTCSMAAHATFNASLVVTALIVALGPFHTFTANGMTLQAPSTWERVDRAGPGMVLRGPSSAILFVFRQDTLGRNIDPDAVLARLEQSALALPAPVGGTLLLDTARVETYPAGRAVRVSLEVKGHHGELVLLPQQGSLWLLALDTAGSRRASHDLDRILGRLVLPVPTAPQFAGPPFCGAGPTPNMAPVVTQYLQATTDENRSRVPLDAKLAGQRDKVAFEDLQTQVSIDEQFSTSVARIQFSGQAAKDAASLRSALGDYDTLLREAQSISPGSMVGYDGLHDQIQRVTVRHVEASSRLRSDLGLPQSTCTFRAP